MPAVVLKSRLGLSHDDLARLRAEGVTSTEPGIQDWRSRPVEQGLRPSPPSANVAEATVIAAPSSVRPQPNARKAKGGAPSDRWNFAATVVVAGARRLSLEERSYDRRQ